MMAYTTLDHVKEFLMIEDNKSDGVLNLLISAVNGGLDAYLSRTILSASYTDTFSGPDSGLGWTAYYPKNFPVTAVSAVTVDGATIPASTNNGPGWVLVDGRVELISYQFVVGTGNCSVTYTAGYTVIPPALESVAMEMVAMRYRERTRLGVVSESDGRGMNRTYTGDFPAWATKILNQYSNVVPA